MDLWRTFPAQSQNCFQLIHRSFVRSFFEKLTAYCLFLIIQQKDRTFGGNFWYCCQKSTLWFQRILSRDSLLSLNSILNSGLERKILQNFTTVFQHGRWNCMVRVQGYIFEKKGCLEKKISQWFSNSEPKILAGKSKLLTTGPRNKSTEENELMSCLENFLLQPCSDFQRGLWTFDKHFGRL